MNLIFSIHPILNIFLILFVFFYLVITILFPKKGSKLGRVLQVISIIAILAAGLYFTINYRIHANRLIEQGVEVGVKAGVSQEAAWCLKSAQVQFLDDNPIDAVLKIRGYTQGCLQASKHLATLCEQLPDTFDNVHRGDVVGKNCGIHGMCEDIFEAAAAYCDSQL